MSVGVDARRALFDRLPRLADLVPFMALADGLPTPVEQLDERLWVQRDDLTASLYGGNKVRKLEFLLPVALRRGGPVVTAGGTGSHHVLAAATYCRSLGLDVEAVLYPQPSTSDARATFDRLGSAGLGMARVPNRYLMPAALAARFLALMRGRRGRPYLLWPGASTPLGTLGYVSAGLELVASGVPEPDAVVAALGSGGTTVGLALGIGLGGWRRAKVVAVRAADVTVTNVAVLRTLEAGTSALLAVGGSAAAVARGPASIEVDGRWLGHGYGHPSPAGDWAIERATAYGLSLEPTYTAKAFAAALDRVDRGQRVVFVQTYAGGAEPSPNAESGVAT